MRFFLTLLAIVFLLSVIIYYYYKKWRQSRQPVPPRHRMLIAVRRREASVSRFLQLEEDEQEQMLNHLDDLWGELNELFSQMGNYVGGFTGPKAGLASGGDEGWTILAMYDLPNLTAFERCTEILESPRFKTLRSHCDIRQVLGRNPADPDGLLRQLY